MSEQHSVIPPGPEAAGMVIVRSFPDGWRYLVLRTDASWDFPKGPLDADENPFDVARREAWAGTALTELHFEWGDDFRETVSYRGSRVSRYYLAESRAGEVDVQRDAGTGQPPHAEFRWVTAEEAEDVLPPRLAVVLDWARATVEG